MRLNRNKKTEPTRHNREPSHRAGNPKAAASLPLDTTAISYEIYWNTNRLRRCAWCVAALTALSLPFAAAGSTVGKAAAIAWIIALFALAAAIARRAADPGPVVIIDRDGIRDKRLQAKPIYWSDIDAVAPCDPNRSQVLELYLKLPTYKLAGTRPLVRLGGALQRRVGIPAMTVSLLLLDCEFIGLCDAIATFRPGLLPYQLSHHD